MDLHQITARFTLNNLSFIIKNCRLVPRPSCSARHYLSASCHCSSKLFGSQSRFWCSREEWLSPLWMTIYLLGLRLSGRSSRLPGMYVIVGFLGRRLWTLLYYPMPALSAQWSCCPECATFSAWSAGGYKHPVDSFLGCQSLWRDIHFRFQTARRPAAWGLCRSL